MGVSMQNVTTYLRAGVLLMTLGFLTACSGVGDYEEPIAELKAALDKTIPVYKAHDEKLTEEKNTKWLKDLMSGAAVLRDPDNRCDPIAEACQLNMNYPGTSSPGPYPATSELKNTRRALGYLQAYVAGLNAIVKEKTAAEITASANKTLANLSTLEKEVAKISGSGDGGNTIASYTPVAGAAVSWLAETYVDHVKVAAMATATKQADPAIKALNDLLQGVGAAIVKGVVADALDTFNEAKKAYEVYTDKITRGVDAKIPGSVINQYLTTASKLDKALKARAAEPFNAFRDAHEKLMKSLNQEDGTTLSQAIAAIQLLKKKVKEFRVIVETIKKV